MILYDAEAQFVDPPFNLTSTEETNTQWKSEHQILVTSISAEVS